MTSIFLTLKSCAESKISEFRENYFAYATFLNTRFRKFEKISNLFSVYTCIKGGV